MMQPVPGHPYVLAAVAPNGYGDLDLTCHCTACNDTWRHVCQYQEKAPTWVAKYAARHAHGAPGVRDHFAYQYHTGLQALRS